MKKSGRLPHAFLFTGDDISARNELARFTAKLLLCEDENGGDGKACNICRHCRRVEADTHPDVILPERTGKKRIYNRETIRAVCSDAFVRPNDCDSKVYVFADCEHIEEATQNLMLKLIEEPPDNVYFIFTAQSKSVFLPTILSRVVTLNASGGAAAEETDPETAEHIEQVKKIIDAIISDGEYAVLKALSSIGENREKISEVLTLAAPVIRDACVIRLNKASDSETKASLIGCYAAGSEKLSEKISYRRAAAINDTIQEYLGYFRQNVNVTAALSALGGQLTMNN